MLFEEIIFDHAKNPHCKGLIANADAVVEKRNPLCGDIITLSIKWENNLCRLLFTGSGCSISQAASSLMCDTVNGRLKQDILEIVTLFKNMISGNASEADLLRLGDAAALQVVRAFSSRTKCALLSWDCLEQCLLQQSCKG